MKLWMCVNVAMYVHLHYVQYVYVWQFLLVHMVVGIPSQFT